MDHQVEHAGDVARAWARQAAAHGLQPQRGLGAVEQAHGGEDHPLLVAAGQNQAAALRLFDQGLRRRERAGERLFHIEMPARGQGLLGDYGVGFGRAGDGYDLGDVQQGGQALERPHAQLRTQGLRPRRVRVVDAGELDFGQAGVFAGVKGGEDAGSDHSGLQFWHDKRAFTFARL